jgi:hypothetical protein
LAAKIVGGLGPSEFYGLVVPFNASGERRMSRRIIRMPRTVIIIPIGSFSKRRSSY